MTFDMRLSEAGNVAMIDELVVKKDQRSKGSDSALLEYAVRIAN